MSNVNRLYVYRGNSSKKAYFSNLWTPLMVKFLRDSDRNIMAKLFFKLLPAILLCIAFKSSVAQVLTRSPDTIPFHKPDTIRKKITDDTKAPLFLQPIPEKNTCSPPFLASASGGFPPYTFSTGNPAVATVDPNNGLIQINSAGTAVITLTDLAGQKQSTLLTVLEVAKPSVTITEAQPVTCLVQDATFTATPSPGLSNCVYSWYFIDNAGNRYNYPNNGSPVLTLNNLVTGNRVYCSMTSNSECNLGSPAISNPITVTVVPYSTLSVSLSQSPEGVIVSGTPITFTATPTLAPAYTAGSYAYNYQWRRNGNDILNANSATYTSSCSQNDDYYNCVVTTQGAPCVTPISAVSPGDQQVTIINSGIPVTATITASANDVYAGTVINFQATLSSNAHAVAYQWQINGVDTVDVTSTLSTFSLKNNDVVTCIIFTDNGCQQVVASNPIKMVLYPTPKIIIPNTFTPNGDSINDVWDIKYLDLYHYSTVKIYNRYGALLFQSKGYPQPWDGKYRGGIVPSGTYYYVISLGTNTPDLGGAITVIK